ncbi:hypothetical protein [Cyanobium sp. Copco_Reservoir_LC18]|uniref:hypothetical protein n=1 Tax=Cyanobium sp. Copco_Reservoir_LC18 TaxID=1328305 RepID=UPI0013585CEF|nr:hypothetical protein [Cyanobium sp. Copco_Reservoir_LC18]
MNHHRQLDVLAAADPNLIVLPAIHLVGTDRDAGHAQRRCQQRAISATKIRIALAYGRQEASHGLQRWTLLSRQVRRSPYARYERELTGLQLVGSPDTLDGTVCLKTCKWNWALRRG